MKLATLSVCTSIFAVTAGLGLTMTLSSAQESDLPPSKAAAIYSERYQQQEIRLLSAPIDQGNEISVGATQRWIF